MIKIQPPVSRYQTIRMSLSDYSKRQSMGVSVLDPCPVSNGGEYQMADAIVTVIQQLVASQSPRSSYRLVELAAGMGTLTKHILDIVKDSDLSLYQKIHFLVTDPSEHCIESIQQQGVFSDHLSHVTLKVQSFESFSFQSEQSPLLVYGAHLFDTTRCVQVVCQDDEWHEMVVESWFPDNESAPLDIRLISKSMHQLTEKLGVRPLSECAELSYKERALLHAFSLSPFGLHDQPFMYHFEALRFLNRFMLDMPENTAFLTVDCGQVKSKTSVWNDHALVRNYGLRTCAMLCFPLYRFLVQQRMLDSYVTHFPDGDAQLFLVTHPTLSNSKTISLSSILNLSKT